MQDPIMLFYLFFFPAILLFLPIFLNILLKTIYVFCWAFIIFTAESEAFKYV